MTDLPTEILNLSTSEIKTRCTLLENEIRIMKSEILRLQHEQSSMNERFQDNMEKIRLNKQLPYLVSNIVEILELEDEDENNADGANINLDSVRKGKCAVIKTSTRTVFTQVFSYYNNLDLFFTFNRTC